MDDSLGLDSFLAILRAMGSGVKYNSLYLVVLLFCYLWYIFPVCVCFPDLLMPPALL